MTRNSLLLIFLMLSTIGSVYLQEIDNNPNQVIDIENNLQYIPNNIIINDIEYPIEIINIDNQRKIIIKGNGDPIIGFDIENIKSQVGDFSVIELDFVPSTILENMVYDNTQISVTNSDNLIVRNNIFNNMNSATSISISDSVNVTVESNIINGVNYLSASIKPINLFNLVNVYIYNNTINGFQTSSDFIGIYAENAINFTIDINSIFDISAVYVTGIEVNNPAVSTISVKIINNNIYKIVASNTFTGIAVKIAQNVIVSNNLIYKIKTTSASSIFYGLYFKNSNSTFVSNNTIRNIEFFYKFYGFYDFLQSNNVIYSENHIYLIHGESTFFYGFNSYTSVDVAFIRNRIDKINLENTLGSVDFRFYGILNNIGSSSNATGNIITKISINSVNKVILYGLYISTKSVFIKLNTISELDILISANYRDLNIYGIYALYDTGDILSNSIYSINYEITSFSQDIIFDGIVIQGNITNIDSNYISDLTFGTSLNPILFVNVNGILIYGDTGANSVILNNNVITKIDVLSNSHLASKSSIKGFAFGSLNSYFINTIVIQNNAVAYLNFTNLLTSSNYASIYGFYLERISTVTSFDTNYISNFNTQATINELRGIKLENVNNSLIFNNLIQLPNNDKYVFNNAFDITLTVDTNSDSSVYLFSFNLISTYSVKLGAAVISTGAGGDVSIDISGYSSVNTFTIELLSTSGATIISTVNFNIIASLNYELKIFGKVFSEETVVGEIISIEYIIFGSSATYTYVENSSTKDSGSWTSGNIINYMINTNEFSTGMNSYKMTAIDSLSNSISLEFMIDILVDTFNPDVLLISADSNFIEGTIGNEIKWQLFDNNGTYQIFVNGTVKSSGSFDTRSIISFSLASISFGLRNISIKVYDNFGNIYVHTSLLTINKDIYNPALSSPTSLAFIEYEENSTGKQLFWTFSDLNPVDYQLLKNGSLIAYGDFNSIVPIYYDLGNLAIGFYNFTFVVYDINDNKGIFETIVHVKYDDVLPIISVVGSATYEIDETDNNVTITISDTNPSHYGIEIDGVTFSNDTFVTSVPFDINVDGFSLGIHTIKVYAYDTNGNTAVYVYVVSVLIDSTDPVVVGISSLSFSEGESLELIFNVSDQHIWKYSILVDNVEMKSDFVPNTNSIIYDVSYLRSDIGISQNFNVTLIANDTYGNSGSYSSIVQVYRDQIYPSTITKPDSIYSINKKMELVLTYVLVDKNPANYTAFLDDTEFQTENWKSGEEVIFKLSGLEIGTHTFFVTFIDKRGLDSIHRVSITVMENIAPVTYLLSESIVTYEEGSIGNQISWQLTDDNPDYYTISVDGSLVVENKVWVNSDVIYFDIPVLNVGTHSITLTAYDKNGLSSSSIVTVEIIEYVNTDNSNVVEEGFIPGFQFYVLINLFGVVLIIRMKKLLS